MRNFFICPIVEFKRKQARVTRKSQYLRARPSLHQKALRLHRPCSERARSSGITLHGGFCVQDVGKQNKRSLGVYPEVKHSRSHSNAAF